MSPAPRKQLLALFVLSTACTEESSPASVGSSGATPDVVGADSESPPDQSGDGPEPGCLDEDEDGFGDPCDVTWTQMESGTTHNLTRPSRTSRTQFFLFF